MKRDKMEPKVFEVASLVTQPMLQRRPKLRSMDSYNQILCRFQKSKDRREGQTDAAIMLCKLNKSL